MSYDPGYASRAAAAYENESVRSYAAVIAEAARLARQDTAFMAAVAHANLDTDEDIANEYNAWRDAHDYDNACEGCGREACICFGSPT